MPQRRAPTAAASAAASEALGASPPDADDDETVRFALAPDAPAWHRSLARFLQRRCGAPDLALAWLFTLGPGRLAVFAVVMAGARVAHGYGLGSLYLMAAVLGLMWANLGERREGEASAYRWERAAVAACALRGAGWCLPVTLKVSSCCAFACTGCSACAPVPRAQAAAVYAIGAATVATRRQLAHPLAPLSNAPAASSTPACGGCLASWTPTRLMTRYGEARACRRALGCRCCIELRLSRA